MQPSNNHDQLAPPHLPLRLATCIHATRARVRQTRMSVVVAVPRVPRVVRETEHGTIGRHRAQAPARARAAASRIGSSNVGSSSVVSTAMTLMSAIAVSSRTVIIRIVVLVLATAVVRRTGTVIVVVTIVIAGTGTGTARADVMTAIRGVVSAPVTRIGTATTNAEQLRSDW